MAYRGAGIGTMRVPVFVFGRVITSDRCRGRNSKPGGISQRRFGHAAARIFLYGQPSGASSPHPCFCRLSCCNCQDSSKTPRSRSVWSNVLHCPASRGSGGVGVCLGLLTASVMFVPEDALFHRVSEGLASNDVRLRRGARRGLLHLPVHRPHVFGRQPVEALAADRGCDVQPDGSGCRGAPLGDFLAQLAQLGHSYGLVLRRHDLAALLPVGGRDRDPPTPAHTVEQPSSVLMLCPVAATATIRRPVVGLNPQPRGSRRCHHGADRQASPSMVTSRKRSSSSATASRSRCARRPPRCMSDSSRSRASSRMRPSHHGQKPVRSWPPSRTRFSVRSTCWRHWLRYRRAAPSWRGRRMRCGFTAGVGLVPFHGMCSYATPYRGAAGAGRPRCRRNQDSREVREGGWPHALTVGSLGI